MIEAIADMENMSGNKEAGNVPVIGVIIIVIIIFNSYKFFIIQ